ncbi:MAG: virB8 family protein [Asticcacaulis sp.]|uniref:virB8 family protein n=1 Tax=Asticcacaulis sp. TaxID=1872648 RepID=UPI003F7B538F
MAKDTVTKAELPTFFADAQGWEADRLHRTEKSEKRAWFVAGCSCLVTAVAVTAVVAMMPLKRIVPYVYAIDRQTGELTIMDAANQRQIVGNQDLLDKHFAGAYVVARDSYDWRLLQTDYNDTLAFSAPQVARDYAARFDGPKAVNKVWGPNIERRVVVTSIQLAPDAISKKAVVRYTIQQRDLQTNTLQPLEHYIATIAYEYHPERTGKEQDLIKNPLGFTVTGFRADPEIGGAPGALAGSEGQGAMVQP